jgi:flagellar basal body-associated protein FliL
MALVATEDRRIGPKVFADVPSSAELEDAQRRVSGLRKRSTFLLLLCVLLIGALAATAAVAYWASHRNDAALKSLSDQLKQSTHDLEQRTTELAAVRDRYAPYNNLVTADREVARLRGSIQQTLANPVYANAIRVATKAEKDALIEDAWANKQVLASNQRAALLGSLQQKLSEFTPPPATAVCNDPRGCPPGTPGN